MSGAGADTSRGDRAVSDVLSVTILFGMVALGALLVVVAGGAALDTAQQQAQTDLAEDSVQEAGSRLSELSQRSTRDTQSFQIAEQSDGELTVDDSATVTIEIRNGTGRCSATRSLGTVVYEDDGRQVAYQGGGVWRTGDRGATMVSPPELTVSDGTIDFSLVDVETKETLSEDREVIASNNVTRSRAETRQMIAKLEDCWTEDSSNDFTAVNISIIIESQYADAWARHGRANLGATVTRPATDEVNMTWTSLEGSRNGASSSGSSTSGSSDSASDGSSSADGSSTSGPTDGSTTGDTSADGSSSAGGSDDASSTASVSTDATSSEAPATGGSQGNGRQSTGNDTAGNGDHDRGHGNECDSYDEDNPGDSNGPQDRANNPHCPGTQSGGSTDSGSNSSPSQPTTPPIRVTGQTVTVEGRRATLKLLGVQAGTANETTRTVVDEQYRDPMDVAFVLDETDSMLFDRDRSFGSGYHSPGTYTVPEGQAWEVWHGREYSRYGPGETVQIPENNYVQKRKAGNDPNGKRIDATRSFIGELDDSTDRASVTQFDTEAHRHHNLSNNFTSVNQSLSADSGGRTDIAAGIYDGIDALDDPSSSNRRVMIVLSDGEDNTYSDPVAAAETAAAENITIHTVGLGDDIDDAQLRAIADVTGGKYYPAENASQLESVFQQVARDTRKTEVRRIDHPSVTMAATSDGEKRHLRSDGTFASVPDPSGADLNQNGRDGSVTAYTLSGLDPQTTIGVAGTTWRCGNYTATGRTETRGNGTYTHTDCVEPGQRTQTVGTQDPSHDVYTDGDTLPTEEAGWWQSGQQSLVGSAYLDGETVDIGDDKALIVLHFTESVDHGHAAVLVDVDEQSVPAGGSDGSDGSDSGSSDGSTGNDGTSSDGDADSGDGESGGGNTGSEGTTSSSGTSADTGGSELPIDIDVTTVDLSQD